MTILPYISIGRLILTLSILNPPPSSLLPPSSALLPYPSSLLPYHAYTFVVHYPQSFHNFPNLLLPPSSILPPRTQYIDQMRKKQPLQISLQLIEQERLAIARRTEHRIAAMYREEENRHKTSAYFYVLLTFCLFVLLLYSYLTFSKKCSCTCTM